MANTIVRLTRFIIISSIDADWVDNEPRYIDDITFVPGASDDELVLREGSIAGSKIMSLKSIDGESRIRDFKKKEIHLAMEFDDCTLTAGSYFIISHDPLEKP
jgi:hypothetical protein